MSAIEMTKLAKFCEKQIAFHTKLRKEFLKKDISLEFNHGILFAFEQVLEKIKSLQEKK